MTDERKQAEENPCMKCTYNGHTTICEQCNDGNDYEHFVLNDPYSKESIDFFKLFIKARKELCSQSPTETYSLEEAIRKAFDASLKAAEATREMYPLAFIMWIGFSAVNLYYRDVDEKWIKTRFEMSENPSEEYDEYTTDELFEYWKQNIRK